MAVNTALTEIITENTGNMHLYAGKTSLLRQRILLDIRIPAGYYTIKLGIAN